MQEFKSTGLVAIWHQCGTNFSPPPESSDRSQSD